MDIPMINEINDNTNAAAEAVKNAILNAMPAAGIDQAALDAAVAEIVAAMPTGGGLTSCIRKIQRGTLQYTKQNYNEEISVTLSGFTNLSKMFVVLNAGLYKYTSTATDGVGGAYIVSLTKTALTILSNCDYVGQVSYQVIEFY